MPSTSQWAAFLLASFLFIQVPGPSLLFTIGRALTVGRRDALLSVVGNALGVVAQVLLVAVGLGALVAASSTVYLVVKLLGAAYVVWLGVQAVRHRGDARRALEETEQTDGTGSGAGQVRLPGRRTGARRSVTTGLVVGVTNPKTLVFFVAFLPQFVDAGAGRTGLQVAVLGLVFGVMACCSDSVWALLAARARGWFTRTPERLDALGATGGVMMIGLGAVLLTQE